MTERYFRVSPLASVDGDFRLHYGHGETSVLEPCKEIYDSSIRVGIIDNNRINPRRLLLVEKDRHLISVYRGESEKTVTCDYPGKSAFIELDKSKSGRALVNSIVSSILAGNPDRRDHLHYASVSNINYAGWHAIWAPLQESGKVFHTRLVADRTMTHYEDPTEADANCLVRAFSKVC